ncbi:sulfotransferase family protein [Pararhodobacter zhoushanensis]|uniref:sulfotransferase family protein n=1 Tax=Pararhodobacter zhoushanensis TaxID=2479545 RepID=UPI000F8E4950|nr:sulfotransferase [Pararhodobacter zhoushanensis]
MTRTNAVDILCIGAQRAMTSWLHQAVSAHPGTWAFPAFDPLTSTSKEAHYWDWNHKRGQDWYRVLTRPLNDALLSLDFTPEYAFLNEAQLTECKHLNPEGKVIYILRDPLARAISALRMHTVWATKHAAADAASLTYDKTFLERCRKARIWDHGAYAANLARWRRFYPDMLVLNFEALSADPLAGLRQVYDHCGLDWDGLDDETRAALTERAQRHVWATPRYTLDADCVNFLYGTLWTAREETEAETGFAFTEANAYLEAAR